MSLGNAPQLSKFSAVETGHDGLTYTGFPIKQKLASQVSCLLFHQYAISDTALVVMWYFEEVRVRSRLLRWACSLAVDVALKIIEW